MTCNIYLDGCLRDEVDTTKPVAPQVCKVFNDCAGLPFELTSDSGIEYKAEGSIKDLMDGTMLDVVNAVINTNQEFMIVIDGSDEYYLEIK